MAHRHAYTIKKLLQNGETELSELTGDVPSWGPLITAHFGERDDVELFYAEIFVPLAGAQRGIYWSMMNPTYGEHISYAGIQMQEAPSATVLGNNICSIWDSQELPPDAFPEVAPVGGHPGIYWDHFGNEGTGLHTSNARMWKLNQRYAMAIRRWTRKGDDNYTYTSMFMYSFADKTWTHWMSARVPGRNLMLQGNPTGFLERYIGDAQHYYGHYGNYFRMLADGQWQKPTHYTVGAGKGPWHASLVDGHSGQDIKVQVGDTPTRESEITLRPEHKNEPDTITPATITSLKATYLVKEQKFECSWVVDNTSPPPIKTLIRISRDGVYGQDIYLHEIMGPSIRDISIKDILLREQDNKAGYKFFARIEYFDIFGQKSNVGYVQIAFDNR